MRRHNLHQTLTVWRSFNPHCIIHDGIHQALRFMFHPIKPQGCCVASQCGSCQPGGQAVSSGAASGSSNFRLETAPAHSSRQRIASWSCTSSRFTYRQLVVTTPKDNSFLSHPSQLILASPTDQSFSLHLLITASLAQPSCQGSNVNGLHVSTRLWVFADSRRRGLSHGQERRCTSCDSIVLVRLPSKSWDVMGNPQTRQTSLNISLESPSPVDGQQHQTYL